jgi:hypothetical protein
MEFPAMNTLLICSFGTFAILTASITAAGGRGEEPAGQSLLAPW